MVNAVISVLLVDDHPVVRQGIRAMLQYQPNLDVVGEAANGHEALQKVGELQHQVVLMDIKMPGMSGTEAARQIKGAHPTTAVIMLTMYDSEMYVMEAIRCGAAGYLTKDSSGELISHAIQAVMDGGTLVRSGLMRRIVQGLVHTRIASGGAGPSEARVMLSEHLTPRELEVLGLLTQGFGNKAISAELSLAEVTVKKHVQSLIGKLGVSDRTHAAIVAVRMGLVE